MKDEMYLRQNLQKQKGQLSYASVAYTVIHLNNYIDFYCIIKEKNIYLLKFGSKIWF